MPKIAVYGGTFLPFGNHHRNVLRYLAGSGEFDEVLVVPSVAHPLKKSRLSYEHRLNMAQLGTMHEEWPIPVEVSQVERNMLRDGVTAPFFTIKVLRYLQQHSKPHGDDTFRFVIGPDIPGELDKWEGVEDIRNEFGFFEAPDMGAHSTQIRQMLSDGNKAWAHRVPPKVAEYIRTHGLLNVQRTTCEHDFKPVPKFSAMWDVEQCGHCGLENSTWVENH